MLLAAMFAVLGFDPDKKEIDRFKEGREEAFEHLMRKYEKKAYATALGVVRDPDDACDVCQDAFLKVYQYLPNFRGESSFSTWLFRIVTNTAIDHARRKKKELERHLSLDKPLDDTGDLMPDLPDDAPQPSEAYEEKESLAAIRDAIYQLPEEQRVVILLRDVQEYSYQEISDITGLNLGTVKSRINRARLTLREILREKAEQNG